MNDYVYDQEGRRIYEKRQLDCFSSDKDGLLRDPNPRFKSAVLKAAPSVVSIVSLGVPPEMTRFNLHGNERKVLSENQVFVGSGTVIECEKNAADGKFSTNIVTTASLFIRSNKVQPSDIEVEVYLANGVKCEGKVLACDFHNNLAVVSIQSDFLLQPAKLRDMDDIMSIHVFDQCHLDDSFELRRHSIPFKIRPGDSVAVLARFTDSRIGVSFGVFSVSYPGLDCKELYSISINDQECQGLCGSTVINCHGEMIGVLAVGNTFLPSNIFSRWWSYYKSCKMYCRPWLGLSVANLQSVNFNFLERLIQSFPNVSSGIIVTEVTENSAAIGFGLRKEDVIVQCDDARVGSILDFFDKIWNKIGATVELGVLRKTEHVNIKVTVGEPKSDDFYRWPVPRWRSRPVFAPDTPVPDPNSERYARLRARRYPDRR